MIAVTGRAVLFIPVKVGTSPAPFAARPIEEFEFVQSNVVPGVLLVKTEAAIVSPSQTIISDETTTTGIFRL